MTELRELLLSAFQTEHKEHLDGIRVVLLKIEQGNASGADLDEAFRRAHSLKAAARVCDFPTVGVVGQRLESLFSAVRKGSLRPVREVIEAVKAALNAIEDWALRLADGRTAAEPVQAVAALDQVLGAAPTGPKPAAADDLNTKLMAAFQVEHKEHLEGIRAILGEVERGRAAAGAVDEAFRRAHSLKGAARIAELHEVETLAHRLETLFAAVREGKLRLERAVIQAIFHGLDAIEDGVAAQAEKRPPPDSARALEAIDRVLEGRPARQPTDEPVAASFQLAGPIQPVDTPAPDPTTETLRVRADHLDRLLRSTGQLLTEVQRQGAVARELTGLSREIDELERVWDAVGAGAMRGLSQLADVPGMERVADSLALVERRVRALSRRARAVRQAHQRGAWALGQFGGQLQEDARRVRMVAAEIVFQSFRKMVRDLARDEGKEVEFRVSGFEVEADRVVLQALKDPLMHALTNAVSHGIEGIEERRRAGKPSAGRVSLRLEVAGARLRAIVEDDGRGIEATKVADAAVRRGLLSEGESASESPHDLAQLLFRPGFSTARAVTGVSGRGMGLSVVHEAVARLQGEVELRPGEEGGTALVLAVPLTVSTQRLLLVSCRGQPFAVPIHGIERLLRVKPRAVESVEGRPMLLLDGQPIPVLSLAALLEIGSSEAPAEGDNLALILLRIGAKRVAVAVDDFLDEREALLRDLDQPAAQISKLAGGILMEDGSVCLVLNVAELVRNHKPSERSSLPAKAAAPAKKKRLTVLVVDDSLTTRTLEKSILEAHGYDVRIATDGIEALARLREEIVDLVITDVQMPRLDGFGLMEEMKKDKHLASLPVIVVTSMARREDQERGLALGADAYIVKRKFDHEELLATIRQII